MSVFFRLLLPLVLLVCLPQRQLMAAQDRVSDVRVVIDVSGSMKQNDPNNLRAPALRMVVGLMPETAQSGVWTFAKFVNMLVAWQDVDDEWRQKAIEQSDNIHSYGLFTNIEQALKKATVIQSNNEQAQRRSLILLSDGFVDIEPGEAASLASRQRILEQLVPELKKKRIAVHTIALSDKADHELLKALSLATDGWYQQADNAEQLQRIFLHLFELSTQRDSVPLQDNQFTIDSSVREMTVLAFRQVGAEQTALQLPDGRILTPDNQSESIRWLHENNYDLITIDNPLSGRWQINAALDPDNRVMVVTDMKLQTTDLPNNVLAGEQLDFEAQLTDKGQTINREDFLQLVDTELQQSSNEAELSLALSREPETGMYRSSLGKGFSNGRNDVVVTMKTATFERQRRQSINVIAMPLNVTTVQLEQAIRGHRIEVQADAKLIKPESLTITALLREQNGSEWPYEMLQTDNNHWRLTLTDLQAGQDYQLSLQVRGETPKGRAVFLQPEAITLKDDSSVLVDNQQVLPESTAEMPVEPELRQPTELAPEQLPVVDETQMTEPSTGMSATMKLMIGNLVIVCLLLVGILWWRKQASPSVSAGDLI